MANSDRFDAAGQSAAEIAAGASLQEQIGCRRTFAIISHPDAGKTTLTEKLLLYAGRVDEAGAVRGRKTQRAVTSDWMELERQRGISVTATVLSFPYRGFQLNLLDTPGHQDFSEDTYRTLTAVDCAIMVLDAVKGVEPQTVKLFRICVKRKIPILTFVNKMDRPGADPLGTLSQIEQVLNIKAVPMNWPIGQGASFQGTYDRTRRIAMLYSQVSGGKYLVPVTEVDPAEIARGDQTNGTPEFGPLEARTLLEEVELLDGAGHPFDRETYLRGEQTPVFFGSALTNFGVEAFLDGFLNLSPPPAARPSDRGMVLPVQPQFSGVVFKIQANMDPKHRDRIAFVRVCSGQFRRDMDVTVVRTGEKTRIKRSHRLFARDRETTDEAYAGDVIGMVNPGQFRLGDTLVEGEPFTFTGQWEFPPESFIRIRCTNSDRRKQFAKGLSQLVEEGVIHILTDDRSSNREPVLAAVGELQFDVVRFRLETEYTTPTSVERLPYTLSRWIDATPAELEKFVTPTQSRIMFDELGMPIILFQATWDLTICLTRNPDVALLEERGFRYR